MTEWIDHTYDVVVVGAGGSGLRATLGSAHALIQLRRKAVLPLRSVIWGLMIGAGICMTLSKGQTGWAIKTRLNIFAAKHRKLFMS